MLNASPVPQPCQLAESFGRCSSIFRDFYIALTGKECRVADQVSLSRISDEYGRFGVWGGNSGADRTGRGSLDDILRNDPNLRSIIIELLDNLYNDLKKGTILAKNVLEKESDDHESQNYSSDEDSLGSLSSGTVSSSDEHEGPQGKKGDMRRLVSVIFDHIRSLYKVAAILRRPSIPNKYIRSVSKDQEGGSVSHFARWDQAHVAEKIKQWALDMEARYEDPVGDSNFLCTRLAAANTRRREQLKYWQKHPDRLPSSNLQSSVPAKQQRVVESAGVNPPVPVRLIDSSKAENIEHSVAPTSKKTTQSFSTVAQSVLNDNETFSGRPKTVYAPTALGGKRQPSRVPDIPRTALGSVTFECPYCFTELEVKAMSQRQLWKKHVFRDLRPYLCTFKQCRNPEKLYVTRHDWIYHETQMHRRRWFCAGDCGLSFNSKNHMEHHMNQMHPESFTELQLPILLDICERPADPNEATECPLCPESLALTRLQDHLAMHLEELALFVLPIDTDDPSHDADSDKAEGIREGAGKLGSDGLSSLSTFSVANIDGPVVVQDVNVFAQFLKSKEDPTEAQVKGWVGSNGLTSLSRAAESGDEAAVRQLLEEGTDPDLIDSEYGWTALSMAARNGHEAIVRLLLEKGAHLDANSRNSQTPLSMAAESGHETIVHLLLKRDAKLDSMDMQGRTALSWAAGNGHDAAMRLLVEAKADIEVRDIQGRTALSWAAGNGHDAAMQLLVEVRADIEARDIQGRTPLSWAAGNGHETAVQLLVEKGADIELKDNNGAAALHRAASNGQEAVVRLLVKTGANVEAEDNDGRTALYMASASSHEAIVQLLQWNPLWVLSGHSSDVIRVEFSPDGQLLASASVDWTVKLWDPKTGSPYVILEGHLDEVNAVAFSPDGQLLASASDDKTVRLWDPKTGSLRATLEGHTNRVWAVAFSPDGQLLASASYDWTVKLWDPKTGSLRATLEGHTNRVWAVAFSPDGQLLASASADNTVRLWDPKTGSPYVILEGHLDEVNAVAFSPDGQLLASASDDKTVRLWDPKTGSLRATLEGHTNRVWAVAFSPDGQLLASASYDWTVKLWDPKTGSLRATLEGHTNRVWAVAFSPDGQLLASASADDTVRLWDPKTGSPYVILEGHLDEVNAVAFSPDGQLLASASDDKTVRLWGSKGRSFIRY